MSFVLARYLGLEIDWHLVTGAPPGVLSAARKYAYCRTALFMVLRSICVRSFAWWCAHAALHGRQRICLRLLWYLLDCSGDSGRTRRTGDCV